MSDEQPTFPVIVTLSDHDEFLHVAADLASLREHLVDDLVAWARKGDPLPDGGSRLEFYDSRARVLTPVLGPLWIISSFEVTDEVVGQDALVSRMRTAALHAQAYEREQRRQALEDAGLDPAQMRTKLALAPSAPLPEDGTVRGYAQAILDVLNKTSDESDPVGIDRGGWLHNAWHAAFG